LYTRLNKNLFLSFSHYLPHYNFSDKPSIIGISNLLPFSSAAIKEESFISRVKLKVLRKTILSSMKRSSAIISLSGSCTKILIRNNINPSKIHTIRNGVDAFWGCKNSKRSEYVNKITSQNYLLYVSHFYSYKNHLRLIEAYANLSKGIKDINQLVLVGNPHNKKYYKKILQLIEKKHLQDNVLLFEALPKEDIRCLYQNTSLMLFPSLIENSPNILLEAMRSGAPVIASDISPIREHCGDAILYFDPLNSNSIKESIESAVANTLLLKILSEQSSKQAKSFTWSIFFDKCMYLIYDELKLNS